MADLIKLSAYDGRQVELLPDIIGSGAMKDVYMGADGQYVGAFFRDPLTPQARDRLENIVGLYRQKIFDNEYGEYWQKYFCWPETLLEWNGKTGLIMPAYDKAFFFSDGRFKGKEKEGKWFASARLRNRFLEPGQKGHWLKYLQICLNISRAVRRLHAAGLAHSDLSYKNILLDPGSGRACVIDIDGLVVPGKYLPDVAGTPDFIAPEVMATRRLPLTDIRKKSPCIVTDRHALAILLYMYLLYRHPLRGPRTLADDPVKDEELCMGREALFIENAQDTSNRPVAANLDASEMPQGDVDKLPYAITGPYLSALFERAFIEGLHNPELRPSAADWETALIKTLDLLQPCQNPDCEAKFFVMNHKIQAACPFCGWPCDKTLPALDLYWSPKEGVFRQEEHRLAVYDKQSLYMWHVNRDIAPNEKIREEDKKPVGDFHFHEGRWIFVNRRLPDMYDKSANIKIEPGQAVALEEGKRLLFSTGRGGRQAIVRIVKPEDFFLD